jgi:hypothetical protein
MELLKRLHVAVFCSTDPSLHQAAIHVWPPTRSTTMTGHEYNRVHELSVPGLQVENLVVKVLTAPIPSSPGSVPTAGKGRDRGFSMALVG